VIGRLHHIVIDCPRPRELAAFYSELLGSPVTFESDDWVVVSSHAAASGIAFQLAPGHEPPGWPDDGHPQQVHLDVMVDDVAAAEGPVLALGARRLDHDTDDGIRRVYADPSGHPFCSIPRPAWAAPVGDADRL
jgi:catechol 2,3-dioxygenase-like lactoylglutathione lyase family enzyme